MGDGPGDAWSAWLAEQRFSGGEQEERLRETLREYREAVLDHAALSTDATVLDVGAGDGLIGFGAIDRLGADGRVIFSDVSEAVLDRARRTAEDAGVADRCEFVTAPAEDLDPIEDGSVDAVTLRSVLIFVEEKERAFAEFKRVLKPGGRLSICEPIGDFDREIIERTNGLTDTFMQYDVEKAGVDIPETVRDIHGKITGHIRERGPDHDAAMDFTERDLFVLAERAGFEEVNLKLHAYHTRRHETEEWEAWLTTASGPGTPTKKEAIEAALTAEERETFAEHVRPLIESRAPKVARGTLGYLWAVKPSQ